MSLMSLTAVELGKKIKAGEVTVKEAVEAAFAQIEKVEGDVHSFVTPDQRAGIERCRGDSEKNRCRRVDRTACGRTGGIERQPLYQRSSDNLQFQDIK